MKKAPYCPYGTYQRATHAHTVRSLSPRGVIRLMRLMFKRSARFDRTKREDRHLIYLGAIKHWRNDLKTMNQYQF